MKFQPVACNSWLLMGALVVMMLLVSCGETPPKVPLIATKSKVASGIIVLSISTIIHPNCPEANFHSTLVPACTGSGGGNSAQELFERDDDGPDKDDDVSLKISIGVSPPKFASGKPILLPAPFDGPQYNVIIDTERTTELANSGAFQQWMVLVESLPSPDLARGLAKHARMIVGIKNIKGNVIAHELGHNIMGGYEVHRNFTAPNRKKSIMSEGADPDPSINCLLSPDEKRTMILNTTSPPP